MIKLNLKYLNKQIDTKNVFEQYQEQCKKIHDSFKTKKFQGSEMTGWMTYPNNVDESMIENMINISKEWISDKKIKDVLLIGIGGSFIGVKAAIDMCLPYFNREINFYYANNISSSYLTDLYKKLSEKTNLGIIVVSKSGTTLEPALALRMFYKLLLEKYGSEGASERVVAVTDASKGTLLKLANKYNWRTFPIPDDIGGRFSVVSPVGLFPCAVAGIDIKSMINGFKDALKDTSNASINRNSAYQYAILRNYLNKKMKKDVEVFITYEPQLFYFSEHLKQLFAESEGKNSKGVLPIVAPMTTDLHSVGQYLQDGKKIFFETSLLLNKPMFDTKLSPFFEDDDGLSFVNGKTVSEINNVAAISTIEAHSIEGNVPNIVLEIDEMNAYNFGYLYSWFSKALAMSARILGVNPFNQPGVENYKNRMFAKLKK